MACLVKMKKVGREKGGNENEKAKGTAFRLSYPNTLVAQTMSKGNERKEIPPLTIWSNYWLPRFVA